MSESANTPDEYEEKTPTRYSFRYILKMHHSRIARNSLKELVSRAGLEPATR